MKTSFKPFTLLKSIVSLALFLIIFCASAQEKTEEFKPSTKVWGLTFGDFYWKTGGDDFKYHKDSVPLTTPFGDAEFAKRYKNESGITFRRLYLGVDYAMAPKFTAKFLLESGDGVTTSGGDRTVFVKAANLEWKNIFKRHTLTIGQMGTTSFSLAEGTWGYRSVEKTIGDARKWLGSNDLGIRWDGLIDSAGNFGYHIVYGTGKGSKPEDNYFRKYYFGVDAKLMDKKILIALNYDMENIHKYDKNYIPNLSKKTDQSKSTIEGFVALQLDKFTVGIEYVNQTQVHSAIKTDTGSTSPVKVDSLDVKPFGLTVFAKFAIVKDKFVVFGRYDMINPDADYKNNITYKINTVSKYNETFMTFGFDYMPNKNVHIIPNVWINSYTDNRKKPDGYDKTIKSHAQKYWDRSADFVPRLTFFYVFK